MYWRLFGVGFTVEFAVFPIAQNSAFLLDFPLALSFQFLSPVPWYPDAWGKQRSRDGEGGWTKIVQEPT